MNPILSPWFWGGVCIGMAFAVACCLWEAKVAPLLDSDERPVDAPRVPHPRDPVDVVAFHSPAKERIAEQIAANNAGRLADETECYLRLHAEES